MASRNQKDYTDTDCTLQGYDNVRFHRKSTEYRYAEYLIRTEYGLVYAYTQFGDDPKIDDFTEMEFIYDRRIYQRRWRRAWSRRTLITLAKRFAHDAVCSEVPFGCEPESEVEDGAR